MAPDGYSAGLRRLGEQLIEEAPARFKRFYYEEILGRSPESSELAREPVRSPADCVKDFLSSDEFLGMHDVVLQRAFPNLARELFLHVPKSGGSTIFHAFDADRRFCPLHLYHGYDNGWFTDKLGYLRDVVLRLSDPRTQYALIYGHPPATRIINNRLKRGWDNVFTTLRDPIDACVSWVNYVLTLLRDDPNHPDVVTWRNTLDVADDRVFANREDLLQLGPRIVERIIPCNAICTTLGRTGSLDSALETAVILGVKFVRIENINDYLHSRGITSPVIRNMSKKFLALSDLDYATRVALYDRISEDLKLYDWIGRFGVQGGGPWLEL